MWGKRTVSRSLKNYPGTSGAVPCDATRVTIQSATCSFKSFRAYPWHKVHQAFPAPSRGPCDQTAAWPCSAHAPPGTRGTTTGSLLSKPKVPLGSHLKSPHSLVPLPRTRFDTFLLIIQVSTYNASEITESLSFIICVQRHVSLQFSQR